MFLLKPSRLNESNDSHKFLETEAASGEIIEEEDMVEEITEGEDMVGDDLPMGFVGWSRGLLEGPGRGS